MSCSKIHLNITLKAFKKCGTSNILGRRDRIVYEDETTDTGEGCHDEVPVAVVILKFENSIAHLTEYTVYNHDYIVSIEWLSFVIAEVQTAASTSTRPQREMLQYDSPPTPHSTPESVFPHRHHAIRTKLADALRKLKYTVYEEVHGTADNGSNRQIDIIVISESLSQGMIIDPTIRFETYKGQPEDVHEEKRAIYVPTIPYYKDKYQLHDISVTGLMFGARGTIPNFSSQFCKTLGLHKSFLNELAPS
ncbi:hypothetical protein ANN_07245 [Periplaneta americana]|uniref:Uncharacterized protein n=1 Tax=Periplaneta americana TaxID=6978 RepID=A0ABQ8TIC9_PERAM|nr:hypothetical protein ANN_07245 [Periplaneta americana]